MITLLQCSQDCEESMSGGTSRVPLVVGEGETGAVLMSTLHGDVVC